MSINQKPLPTRGYNGEDILRTMRTMRNHDADWEDGKVWCLVYNAGEELSQEEINREFDRAIAEQASSIGYDQTPSPERFIEGRAVTGGATPLPPAATTKEEPLSHH